MGNFYAVQNSGDQNTGENKNPTSPHLGLSADLQTNGPAHVQLHGDGNATVSRPKVTTYRPDDNSGFTGPVLSTLHTKHGRPLSDLSQVTDDSTVNVNGMQISVRTALNSGILTKDAQGNLRESGNVKPKESSTVETPKAVKVNLAPRSPELNEMRHTAGSRGVDQQMASAINSIVLEKDHTPVLAALSRATGGLSPKK